MVIRDLYYQCIALFAYSVVNLWYNDQAQKTIVFTNCIQLLFRYNLRPILTSDARQYLVPTNKRRVVESLFIRSATRFRFQNLFGTLIYVLHEKQVLHKHTDMARFSQVSVQL